MLLHSCSVVTTLPHVWRRLTAHTHVKPRHIMYVPEPKTGTRYAVVIFFIYNFNIHQAGLSFELFLSAYFIAYRYCFAYTDSL